MEKNLPSNDRLFSKVKAARELLREKAESIINEYLDVAMRAKEVGDYKTATQALQWLLEHMPSEEDGTKVVDTGVDIKQPVVEVKNDRPAIQIGIQVGGIAKGQIAPAKPKELTVGEVIDAE